MRKGNDLEVVAQAIICPEDSDAMTLKYFLLQLHVPGKEWETQYGLRVDKYHHTGALLEREETQALTSSLDDVTALANAFAAGAVPPCVLNEMVEEWQDVMLVNA